MRGRNLRLLKSLRPESSNALVTTKSVVRRASLASWR